MGHGHGWLFAVVLGGLPLLWAGVVPRGSLPTFQWPTAGLCRGTFASNAGVAFLYPAYHYAANLTPTQCSAGCNGQAICAFSSGDTNDPSSFCMVYLLNGSVSLPSFIRMGYADWGSSTQFMLHATAPGGLWPANASGCSTSQQFMHRQWVMPTPLFTACDVRFAIGGQLIFAVRCYGDAKAKTDILGTWQATLPGSFASYCSTPPRVVEVAPDQLSGAAVFTNDTRTLQIVGPQGLFLVPMPAGEPQLIVFSPLGQFLLAVYTVGSLGFRNVGIDLHVEVLTATGGRLMQLRYSNTSVTLNYVDVGAKSAWMLRTLFWFTSGDQYLVAPANGTSFSTHTAPTPVPRVRYKLGLPLEVPLPLNCSDFRAPPMGTGNVVFCGTGDGYNLLRLNGTVPVVQSLSPAAPCSNYNVQRAAFAEEGNVFVFACGAAYSMPFVWLRQQDGDQWGTEVIATSASGPLQGVAVAFNWTLLAGCVSGVSCAVASDLLLFRTADLALQWRILVPPFVEGHFVPPGDRLLIRTTQGIQLLNASTGAVMMAWQWPGYLVQPDTMGKGFLALSAYPQGSNIFWVDLEEGRTSSGTYCVTPVTISSSVDSLCSTVYEVPSYLFIPGFAPNLAVCQSLCGAITGCSAADYSPLLGCRLFGTALNIPGQSVDFATQELIFNGFGQSDGASGFQCYIKGTHTPTLTPTPTTPPTRTHTLTATLTQTPLTGVCGNAAFNQTSSKVEIVIPLQPSSCQIQGTFAEAAHLNTFAQEAYWIVTVTTGGQAVTLVIGAESAAFAAGVVGDTRKLPATAPAYTVLLQPVGKNLTQRRDRSIPFSRPTTIAMSYATYASSALILLVTLVLGGLTALATLLVALVARRLHTVPVPDWTVAVPVYCFEDAPQLVSGVSLDVAYTAAWACYPLGLGFFVTFGIALICSWTLYNGVGPVPVFVWVAVGLCFAGLLLVLAAAGYLLHRRRQPCPACGRKLWAGQGLHVLSADPGGPRLFPGRLHLRCLRCRECRRPVRHRAWVGSSAGHLYHDACWGKACSRALHDPALARDLPPALAAHVAAAAIQAGLLPVLSQILKQHPEAASAVLDPADRHTLLTVAMQHRSEKAVDLLLAGASGSDVLPSAALHVPTSDVVGFRLVCEETGSDVFLRHPFMQCLGLPVYVGRYTGRYLYHLEGEVDDSEGPLRAGWHVSPTLGGRDGAVFVCRQLHVASAYDDATAPARLAWLWTFLSKVTRRQRTSATSSPSSPLSPPKSESGNSCGCGVKALPVYGLASELDAALDTGWAAGVQRVVGHLRRRFAWAGLWCWQDDLRLWHAFPPAIQQAIVSAPDSTLEVALPTTCGNVHLTLDLIHLQQYTAGVMANAKQDLRFYLPSLLVWADPVGVAGHGGAVACALRPMPQQQHSHRLAVAGQLPRAGAPLVLWNYGQILRRCTEQPAMLRALVEDGVAPPPLWLLHSPYPAVLSQTLEACPAAVAEWHSFMGGYFEAGGLPPATRSSLPYASITSRGADATVGRLPEFLRSATQKGLHTDGLMEAVRVGNAPDADTGPEAYPPDYVPPHTLMQFVVQLAANPLGLVFERHDLVDVLINFVLKLAEVHRQSEGYHFPHHDTTRQLSIYAYTYELPGDGQAQIYASLNQCMRAGDRAGLEFWRPFIWYLDCALLLLPEVHAPLYRGINVTFNDSVYQPGCTIRWAAYSSSSTQRAVAEAFAKGALRGAAKGTLFFLQSQSARDISRFSRFAGEGEVLFLPNTLFHVVSTLFANTPIGAFYSGCDNVEVLPRAAPRRRQQLRGASTAPPRRSPRARSPRPARRRRRRPTAPGPAAASGPAPAAAAHRTSCWRSPRRPPARSGAGPAATSAGPWGPDLVWPFPPLPSHTPVSGGFPLSLSVPNFSTELGLLSLTPNVMLIEACPKRKTGFFLSQPAPVFFLAGLWTPHLYNVGAARQIRA